MTARRFAGVWAAVSAVVGAVWAVVMRRGDDDRADARCPRCGGFGRLHRAGYSPTPEYVTCPTCHGTGQVGTDEPKGAA